MPWNDGMKIKIFADGADLDGIKALAANPLIKGFTTNPTLMRKAGVDRLRSPCAPHSCRCHRTGRISFEVFADDFDEMIAQARCIASWGKNVNVKIPVTNTKGEFTGPVIGASGARGRHAQRHRDHDARSGRARSPNAWQPNVPAIVSVFAGRIADTGVDPVPLMKDACDALAERPKAELLWASPRELLNIFQADAIGCHIITVTNDVLAKLSLVGKDLDEYSLETVQMFYNDATRPRASRSRCRRSVQRREHRRPADKDTETS